MDPVALLLEKVAPKCVGLHHKIQKDGYNVGYLSQNPYVLLKYLVGMHHHLCEQVMLFKPKLVDKACVQALYPENIGLKRVQSGSKQKEKYEASKEGKKKK